MPTHRSNTRVPVHLTPKVSGGYIQGLTIYKTGDAASITVGSTTITVDGETFTFTDRSLPRLAAEINRALPAVDVTAGINEVPQAGDLIKYDDDTSAEGGTVVRYRGLSVRSTERTRIRVLPPYPDSHLGVWWARINRGSFQTVINGIQYVFAVPEYDDQPWSPRFGKPYVEHANIEAEVLDEDVIKVPRGPILWEPGLITVVQNGTQMSPQIVKDVDENNRLIYLNEKVELSSSIVVSYVYKEESYLYKGVDLNPSLAHSPHLVEQFVLFYLKPYKSITGLVNSQCVFHVVGPDIESAIGLLPNTDVPLVLLGALRTRQVEDSEDVSVRDARPKGGGVKDDVDPYRLENESEFYTDIGNWDGRPYPGNSVLVMRVPRTVLDTFTTEQVNEIARRHVAAGTVTLVDYQD